MSNLQHFTKNQILWLIEAFYSGIILPNFKWDEDKAEDLLKLIGFKYELEKSDRSGVKYFSWDFVVKFVKHLIKNPEFVKRYMQTHPQPEGFLFAYFKQAVEAENRRDFFTIKEEDTSKTYMDKIVEAGQQIAENFGRLGGCGTKAQDFPKSTQYCNTFNWPPEETPKEVIADAVKEFQKSWQDFKDYKRTWEESKAEAYKKMLEGEAWEVKKIPSWVNEINIASKTCHASSKNNGWYEKDPTPNLGEKLCLIHSEVSEALEGVRKDTMDKHLPHRKTEEVELADALIRIFDYAGYRGLDLGGAMLEKLRYNKSEAGKKNREGKKF